MTGNTEAAVELCMQDERYADAVIIAMTGGPELLARTQYQYLKNRDGYLANIISALVTEDWSGVIAQCTTDSWKEALAATLTHAKEQLPELCERLGDRLQESSSSASSSSIQSAILCFICAGNVEKLVDYWPALNAPPSSSEDRKEQIAKLQDLVEIVMLLQKALELQGRHQSASGKLASLLTRYAGLLVAQGALSSALSYLGPSEDPQVVDMRERLYYSLGHKQQPSVRQTNNQRQSIVSNGGYGGIPAFGPSRSSIPNASFMQPAPSPAVYNTGFPGGQTMSPPSAAAQPWMQPQTVAPAWNAAPPVQPMAMQPPLAGPPPPSMSHPPRPSSVGSQGSAAPRSKYLLDPSVQSAGGSGYGQSYNQPPMVPSGPFGGGPDPMYGASGIYQPMIPAAPAPMMNPQFAPFTPAPMANQQYVPGVPPLEMGQAAMELPPPPQKTSTPPPGWNDPPPLRTSRKSVSLSGAILLTLLLFYIGRFLALSK